MKQVCAVLAAIAVLVSGAAPWAAADEVAVIVNKSNPVIALTIVQLRAILLGAGAKWTSGKRITVFMTRAGQPERSGILRIVCGMSETDFNMHFIHGRRNPDGSVSNEAREHPTVFDSGPQVRQSVATAANAVGFIKASQVDDSVKIVAVDGSSPGEPAYKLKIK
jgi:ABC-type phosphate transport system substrate-binding protein